MEHKLSDGIRIFADVEGVKVNGGAILPEIMVNKRLNF